MASLDARRRRPAADVFGLGEHHREYAARTERIRLTPAVTVLSSDDPVRVFQQFATLDLLSKGQAELLVGRARSPRGLARSAAFEGRLVPQDPSDEPVAVLLDRIRAERSARPVAKRRARQTA